MDMQENLQKMITNSWQVHNLAQHLDNWLNTPKKRESLNSGQVLRILLGKSKILFVF